MKIETKERIIKSTVYIAEDGKRFMTKSHCLQYEESLKRAKEWEDKKSIVNNMIINFDLVPMVEDTSSDRVYTYFKVENDEDVELLVDVFNIEDMAIPFIKSYPDIIICESYGAIQDINTYKEIIPELNDMWWDNVNNIKQRVKEYWGKLGYDITITKKDNQEER